MKRELKFRVFDKKAGKYIYPNEESDLFLVIGDGNYFEVQDHSSENYQENSNDLSIVNSLEDELVLEQFSGFQDSEGKEIYEGDIVYIAGQGNTEIEFPFTELVDAYPEGDIERIIGNIHQNHQP